MKKKRRFERIKEFVVHLERKHEKCNYKELLDNDPKKFVYSVFNHLFGRAFGTLENSRIVVKQINGLIDSTRYQISRLSIDGIKMRDIDWLYDGNNSVTSFVKMQELLKTFMSWLFNHFLVNLLKTNYYITETSYSKNKLMYIKYSEWKRMEYKLYNLDNFTKCESQSAHSVRLLLKPNGARFIVNQSKKNIHKFNFKTSLNQILKNAFSIFNYEKIENLDKFGNSCFGKNDIFNNLLKIKETLLQTDSDEQKQEPIYFCKIDIQACFDTINQQLLMDTIESFLQKPEYLIRKYSLITKRLEYKRSATDSTNFTDFHEFISKQDVNDSIFIDAVNYQFESREKIMELLETHLLNHTIKQVTWDNFSEQDITVITFLPRNLKNKAHSLYYDCELNSPRTVLLNVYQTFVISAMRFSSYLQYLLVNKEFVIKIIKESLDYQYALVRTRSKIKTTRKEIHWLGTHAFIRILKLRYNSLALELLKEFKYTNKYDYLINDATTKEMLKINY
ncbi:hypothetical protein HDV06_004639 [Boothiomyces sp. JEL0866]|nr:hypothetical protein HDV06_004639 [Boothiomyces sp. JEL0866]